MLLVKTEVKESGIKNAGRGLYLLQEVEKGQILWKKDMSDIIIVSSEYEQLKGLDLVNYIEKYGTCDESNNFYIDSDNCKFINSSKKRENVLFLEYIGVALEDLSEGTELFCDYEKICQPWHYKKILNIK